MKQTDKDKLADLFHKMPLENPSQDFENGLMNKINFIAVQKQQAKSRRVEPLPSWMLVVALVAIMALPAIILYVMGFSFSVDWSFPSMSIPILSGSASVFIPIALAVLILAIGDTLLRRYMTRST